MRPGSGRVVQFADGDRPLSRRNRHPRKSATPSPRRSPPRTRAACGLPLCRPTSHARC